MEEAIECFEKAIEVDPDYALAHAALGECVAASAHYRPVPSREVHKKAKAAAQKALELDDTLAGPHATLAGLLSEDDWDWEGAEREFRRALELNPGHATAHQWYAEFLLILGRTKEAMEEARKAVELDPLSPVMNARLGLVHYFDRRFEEAERQFRTTIALDPDFAQAHLFLAFVLAAQSRLDEALAEAEEASSPTMAAFVHGLMGDTDYTRKVYEELLERRTRAYVAPTWLADLSQAMGDLDKALEWLEVAAEERDVRLGYRVRGPWSEIYRGDPRFDAILRRLGLEP